MYNSSGAFATNYTCYKTGCGAGIDNVVIMRMVCVVRLTPSNDVEMHA